MKRDYYEVLGVPRDASLQDIKRAYRALAVQHHPDRNPGDAEAEERFKEASEAYQVLSDQDQRRRYDAFGHAGLGASGTGFNADAFADFSDILGDLFGTFFGGGRPRRPLPRRGEDLRYEVEIELADAVRGLETTLEVPRTEGCARCSGSGAASAADIAVCSNCAGQGQVRYTQGFFSVSRACPACRGQGRRITRPCPDCSGSGRLRSIRRLSLRIPPGVDTGSRLRLTGEGEGGRLGGPAGDLYVDISVRPHADFRRDGSDLHCRVPITFSQAALGATLRVPTLDGEEVEMQIPAGTQSGAALRSPGRGLRRLDGRGVGDLVVTVHVETPRRLSRKARDLLRQLAGEEAKPGSGGQALFERVKELLG